MSVLVHTGAATPPPSADVVDGLRVIVAGVDRVADEVVAVTLEAPPGHRLPPWLPGAHVDLVGPTGIERQYSLCGVLDDARRWQVAVLREEVGRGGSAAIHDALAVGDEVCVRGPHNRFRLTDAKRYLFVAGGIGITPILSMVRLVEASERPWTLAYAGRRRSGMAFLPELEAFGDRVRLYPGDEGARMPVAEIASTIRPSTAVYACGPARLVDAVTEAVGSVDSSALHVERFAPSTDPAQAAAGRAFDVDLARSARTVHVPDGTTVLDAVRDAGVRVAASCSSGVCGTCEVRVLKGRPDHRDSILTSSERSEGGSMFVCVSRAISERLVLDL